MRSHAVTVARRPHFVIPRTSMLLPMFFLFSGARDNKQQFLLNSDPLAALHTDLISLIFRIEEIYPNFIILKG